MDGWTTVDAAEADYLVAEHNCPRRQVITRLGHGARVLPVVDEGSYDDDEAANLMRSGFICARDGIGSLYRAGIARGELSKGISHEPWAADLAPGDVVMFASVETVEPITEMVCQPCGGDGFVECERERATAEAFGNWLIECGICDAEATVPLALSGQPEIIDIEVQS
jgi:hypothetical protein